MRRMLPLPRCALAGVTAACAPRRWNATTAGAAPDAEDAKTEKPAGGSLSAAADEPTGEKPRNFVVMSNTTKGVYVHFHNRSAAVYWWRTDFHYWFVGVILVFVGSQVLVRYRVSSMATVQQAKLGENLLDQRTRDLLSDIETLRAKDPLRLENEANFFHEKFWKKRAKKMAAQAAEKRETEINRGILQGEARGTDMSEWLGAKNKDDAEREVARRTHDYIQGFHQHLKSKRLI